MGEGPKPRRRWLRFSLRTMFLLLTAFCLWLGRNTQIVRERNSMRYEVRRNGGYVILDHAMQGPLDANGNEVIGSQSFDIDGGKRQLPLVRRLLGDERVVMIQVRRKGEVDGVKRVFPECLVVVDRLTDSAISENLGLD
jgi:hypothetical protein